MAQFLNHLTVSPVDDVIFRVSNHPFRYQSDLVNDAIEVPVGFYTDFESMVRWVPTLYALLGDVAHEPAVIHDWLYYSAITSREIADKVLFEAMGVKGLPAWRRYPIFWGVRMGGWAAWNGHRKAGHTKDSLGDRYVQ